MSGGWLGADWGNVPAWVGSLLTSTSLLIAAVSYQRNNAERAREQADREMAQAAKVSGWWLNSRAVSVRNANDVAVHIQLHLAGGREAAVSERVSFAPGETRILRVPADLDAARPDDGVPLSASMTIVDSFGRGWIRDADGDLRRATAEECRQPAERSALLRWDDRGR